MRGLVRLTSVLAVALVSAVSAQAQELNVDRDLFSRGMEVYIENCAVCHGENGDGKVPLASGFAPRPRDLTKSNFKFRSSELGQFPLQSDLAKVIRYGVVGAYGRTMPKFEHLSEADVIALTEVVRVAAGAPGFGTPATLPPRPEPADLNRGKALFKALNCVGCHGRNGDGQGPQASSLVDADGLSIRPADLRVGEFKGGNSPEDLWMRLYNGVDGTPMPSFGRNTSDEDLWALVEYVLTFSGVGS